MLTLTIFQSFPFSLRFIFDFFKQKPIPPTTTAHIIMTTPQDVSALGAQKGLSLSIFRTCLFHTSEIMIVRGKRASCKVDITLSSPLFKFTSGHHMSRDRGSERR